MPVLSRDVFHDPTQRMAQAALALGLAHRKLNYSAQLGRPSGTAIAAPLPQTRELACRDGLKYYARIPRKNIRAALRRGGSSNGRCCTGRAPRTRAGKSSRLSWTSRRAWR